MLLPKSLNPAVRGLYDRGSGPLGSSAAVQATGKLLVLHVDRVRNALAHTAEVTGAGFAACGTNTGVVGKFDTRPQI